MSRKAQVVICGAGIAGVSTAYHLTQAGFQDILIVDPLPPLSLTSDRSTESYRNWWPDVQMLALMNRSIDLMERLSLETGNVFRLNRRGYLYCISNEAGIAEFIQRAEHIAASGAGSLRIHADPRSAYVPDASGPASGADLLVDPDLIRAHYPYITHRAVAALHVRRAGWLSAQQLGMLLLERARRMGVQLIRDNLESILVRSGRVAGARLGSGEQIDCEYVVFAAGPYLKQAAALLNVDIPVKTELHLKVTFQDQLGIVDRSAPLLIWDEPQHLPWEHDELEGLRGDADTRWMTDEFPPGAHLRPEGSGESKTLLMLWDYQSRYMEPLFPTPLDELYPDLALRGLSTMVPGLARYFNRAPRPYIDGGYYVRTPDNRLLAGPLPVSGAYIIGALSGYGIMSACAAGELVAARMAQSQLPPYADAFSLERYDDPSYRERFSNWDNTGQL